MRIGDKNKAAALVNILVKKFFLPDLSAERRAADIKECICNAGFDFSLQNYYRREEYIEILESIITDTEGTPVRPGWLGACFKELADMHYALNPNNLSLQVITNNYWKAI